MHGLTRVLAAFCAILMLVPVEARAATLQTGIGYVAGDCRTIGTSDERACFSGGRFDLGINGVVKDRDDPPKPVVRDGSEGKTVTSTGSGWNFGGGGEAFVFTLVVILLLFGVIWLVTGIVSRRMTMGIYSTFDFQSAGLEGETGTTVESYHAQSTGVQAHFYVIPDTNLALNVGVAGTTAQIATHSSDDGDRSFNLRGISSKFGLGYMPLGGGSMYGMLEFSGTYFGETSVSKYVKDKVGKELPVARHSTTLVLGWAF